VLYHHKALPPHVPAQPELSMAGMACVPSLHQARCAYSSEHPNRARAADENAREAAQLVAHPPHILITTPTRLADLVDRPRWRAVLAEMAGEPAPAMPPQPAPRLDLTQVGEDGLDDDDDG
jgi:hypothetical protein